MLNWSRLKKFTFFIVAVCFFTLPARGQDSDRLPRSVPEREGVSAAMIDSFLNAAARSKHEFHSLMFLRHGKVIAEGWWNPYSPDLRHSLYSTSKSFTSTAVGFAVSENKLKVTDKVISFFPQSLPDTVKPYLAQLTVKDLLTMTAGQEPDPTINIAVQHDWVKAFLATPIVHQPGTKFLYNTAATFMLSAIVQKVTGQKEVDYLKPRLFDPLGIKGMDWEMNEQGINTGGWGLRVRTEDMAKLGELYLQKGMWQGKQLLPKAWIEEATTFKIDQAPGIAQSKRDSSDWMQGYCYQFWRCRHNAFRADGAYGQYIIVMPDQDAVIAITCEAADMQNELNLVWKYLLPSIKAQSLQADRHAEIALQDHLAALSLPPLKSAPLANAPLSSAVKTYTLQANSMNIKSLSFSVINKTCKMMVTNDASTYTLSFENGQWLMDKTNLPMTTLLSKAKEDFSVLLPYKVEGSFAWVDGQTLKLKLRYIESPHSETITCSFAGDKLTAIVENSPDFGRTKTELKGDLVK